jgi:hypothetical protein
MNRFLIFLTGLCFLPNISLAIEQAPSPPYTF